MGDRVDQQRQSGLWVTEYNSSEPHRHPEFDPSYLEETNKGALPYDLLYSVQLLDPFAVVDQDGDGYREIERNAFEQIVRMEGLDARPFPLAPFFDDRNVVVEGHRLKYLPEALKEATDRHDFPAARSYFARLAGNFTDPLESLALPLAAHLAASAMHAGVNIDDGVSLEGPSGFSVFRDGRLRLDCGLYAQLAHSDLAGVRGVRFTYVILQKSGASGEILSGGRTLLYQNASLQCYEKHGCLNMDPEQIPFLFRNEADLGTRYERLAVYTRRTFTDGNELGMKRPHEELIRVRKGVPPRGTGWQYRGEEIVAYNHLSWVTEDEERAAGGPKISLVRPTEGFIRGAIDLFRTRHGEFNHVVVGENYGEAYPSPRPVKPGEEARLREDYDDVSYRLFIPLGGQSYTPYSSSFDPNRIAFDTPSPASTDDTGAHMIGIASIGLGHLVIDNHVVEYVETDDIWGWVKTRYGSQYENFSRRPTYLDEGNTIPF